MLTDSNLSVLYLSLEMGINQEIKNKIKRWEINPKLLGLLGKATLNDLKEYADKFDVIMIDSFQKLFAAHKTKAEEIDKLRQEFPETLFFAIFQKTTSGTMRGGSQILFDVTMNIDISIDKESQKRVALMRKSRYGTQSQKYMIPQF